MLPPIASLLAPDGQVTVVGIAAAAVPATAKVVGGVAVSPSGQIYVRFV